MAVLGKIIYIFLLISLCLLAASRGSPTSGQVSPHKRSALRTLPVKTTANPTVAKEVSIMTSSQNLTSGYTTDLLLNCSYRPEVVSQFAAVTAIILSKSSSVQGSYLTDIAELNPMTSMTVVVKDGLGADVTGGLGADGGMEIVYTWHLPGQSVAGDYRCTVYGVDTAGHPIDISDTFTMREVKVDNQVLIDEIRAMKTAEDDLLKQLKNTTQVLEETRLQLDNASKENSRVSNEKDALKYQLQNLNQNPTPTNNTQLPYVMQGYGVLENSTHILEGVKTGVNDLLKEKDAINNLLQNTTQILNRTKSQLDDANRDKNDFDHQLHNVTGLLLQSNSQLLHMYQEKDSINQQLQNTTQMLSQARLHLNGVNQEKTSLQNQLTNTTASLLQAQTQLTAGQSDLNFCHYFQNLLAANLSASNSDLLKALKELNNTKTDLARTNIELSLTKNKLNETIKMMNMPVTVGITSGTTATTTTPATTRRPTTPARTRPPVYHPHIDLTHDFDTMDVFEGHTYLISKEDKIDIDDYSESCEDIGGYLAEINSKDEFKFLTDLIDDLKDDNKKVYIGGEYKHGEWVYLSSGRPLDYTNWEHGDAPDDKDDTCLIIKDQDHMKEEECKDKDEERFACEIDYINP